MHSTLETPPQIRHLAQVLRWAALALLLCLVSGLMAQLLPPMLTSSAWQLQLADTLIAQAPLLVLAVCCLQLAGWLDGVSPQGRWLAAVSRRLALPLALAYGLLIPLQGVAGWSAWRADALAAQQQVQRLRQGLSQLRAEAGRTTDTTQLEMLLRRLPQGGPPLASLGSDLPSQRRQLIAGLDQASRQLDGASRQRRLQGLQLAIRRFVRVLVSALGLAALLVVVSQWRPRRRGRLVRLLRRRPGRRPSSGAYLRQLSREQSAP
ncbi:MAG: hypothetical protein VKN13_05115 [Cyanobacteriota bacterium]|nr:hypothetical protein [Cyanobacteriota bacterium]